MSAALAPGFAEPVLDAQSVFRAVLTALSRPGLPCALATRLVPPAPLTPELAAVALALADPDAPIWLDAPLAASPAVARFLRFHTGARLAEDPAEAAFALVSAPADLASFAPFAQGSDEYPDRSTTLVMAVAGFAAGTPLILEGPGIRGRVRVAPHPLSAAFAGELAANRDGFPRGLDCLLVGAGEVVGIPRSSRVVEAL